ncbi:peptidyl-glycine alpha-amidating monooxygenase A-like isoform X1 [Haliotis asinina]|uniref:peptidyl-glycine alpha-amidating monooxygenase A-like isoform X1 n=1 Tax=Haliotis asinina TaxID=109174 RepID=UPI0035325730
MAMYRCLLFLTIMAPGMTISGEGTDTTTPRQSLPVDTRAYDVRMKGAHPSTADVHLCSSYTTQQWLLGETEYIVKFEVLADNSSAHHMTLYGCDGEPARTTDVWKCPGVCQQGVSEVFLFTWAHGVPSTSLPDEVGFKVGRGSEIQTLVLQTHYQLAFNESAPTDFSGIRIHITSERQKYAAGIYLLENIRFSIPPNTANAHVDVSCTYQEPQPLYPFAYRTHSHSLGKVITGYMFNHTWLEIGKGNPQGPQIFYPVHGSYIVRSGDELVARCTFDSRGRDTVVNTGRKTSEEMCKFYMMYYTNSTVEMSPGHCMTNQHPERLQNLPGDAPLSPAPPVDELTHKDSNQQQPSTETGAEKSKVKTVTPFVSPHPLVLDSSWPSHNLILGHVVGVATDRNGNVYIFHRGSRTWTARTFDRDNRMLSPTPIPEDVILVLNRQGTLLRKFGRNQFYLPHGIEVDSRGNIWVTDTGLHQVMRIPPGGTLPDMVLGERLVPGNDTGHFCQPADVAVLQSGDFYVADGFCNGRIVKYSSNGTFMTQWGRPADSDDGGRCCCDQESPGIFNIVPSITVAEDRGLVCAADCMHGRIQCFQLDGSFRFIVSSKQMGPYVLATEYCPLHGGILFVVNGHDPHKKEPAVYGVTVAIDTGEVVQQWDTFDGLQSPHDVTVDSTDHDLYVGELSPAKVWRLSMNTREETAKGNHVTLIVVAVLITLPVVSVIIGLAISSFIDSGRLPCSWCRKSFSVVKSHQGFTLLESEDDEFCACDE